MLFFKPDFLLHTLRSSRIIICFLIMVSLVFIPYSSPSSSADDIVNSSLVYLGNDGWLVYVPDVRGNTVPDFSHAGYGGGGVALPDVPVKVTVSPVDGDDSMQIQAAIDRVSRLPLNQSGFRGAVLLARGTYDIYYPLQVQASGVVLRGEGNDDSGTVLTGLGKHDSNNIYMLSNYANMIEIGGGGGYEDVPGTARALVDDYVPVGMRTFRVEHSRGLAAGDAVIVRSFGSPAWIRETGMYTDQTDFTSMEPVRRDMERFITAIEGDRITVDVPLVCPVEAAWGGGEVVKSSDKGRIYNVGVENMRGVSQFDETVRETVYYQTELTGPEYLSDEDHYWNFINVRNAANIWVRDVNAVHFAHSCVRLAEMTKWVTVQDCSCTGYISKIQGARRAPFVILGQMCLVQRCSSDNGRHDFVLGGNYLCGPNVFLDCTAGTSYSSSEPHGRWSTGVLFDNVRAPLTVRYTKRAVPVWCGAYCYLWNCERMFLVQKPPTAQNYVIGHIGEYGMIHNIPLIDFDMEPGFIESQGTHVSPRSLYLTQLEKRLGKEAVANIAK